MISKPQFKSGGSGSFPEGENTNLRVRVLIKKKWVGIGRKWF